MLTLSRALRVHSPETVAFVGAGGKSTAMFQLARELAPAVVTTTTHLGNWQASLADQHNIWNGSKGDLGLQASLDAGITLLTGPLDSATDRYGGLPTDQFVKLREYVSSRGLPLLVEADGARQRPLKAPGEHEPAIPESVDTVVVVAGMSGLGRPLDAEVVHRPELFARLGAMSAGQAITPAALARVLTHPQGGLKNIPPGARRALILNQSDTPELQSQASALADTILSTFQPIAVASLQHHKIYAVHEKTAGIILAAGEAQRFGQAKQLLDYRGRPFVQVVARQALDAGLDPVIVVTGAYAASVEAAVGGLPVEIARNDAWSSGQASSIRMGLGHLDASPSGGLRSAVGAAIFLLADQPQITAAVLRALVEFHSLELPPVAAPLVEDRRANPTLFDQTTFADLMQLSGDRGGRALFSKYSPSYLPWFDGALLHDVDTPEDYDRLLQLG
jgi:molybdenum cofactor cytidylyltransferase